MKEIINIFFGKYDERTFIKMYVRTLWQVDSLIAPFERWKLKKRFAQEGTWYAPYDILKWHITSGIGEKWPIGKVVKMLVAEVEFFKELFWKKVQEVNFIKNGVLQGKLLDEVLTAILIQYPYSAGPLYTEGERMYLAHEVCASIPREYMQELTHWYFDLPDEKQVEYCLAMPKGISKD